MKTFQSRLSSQRGAVLIHVGIALLGLIAFATFVADYGVMWVGRSESQTAAVQLYQSLGYVQYGTYPRYARVDGQWMAGLFFWKDLAAT